jgi:hypothetical protein
MKENILLVGYEFRFQGQISQLNHQYMSKIVIRLGDMVSALGIGCVADCLVANTLRHAFTCAKQDSRTLYIM